MLISKDINPVNSIYYIGALVIEMLRQKDKWEVVEIYDHLYKSFNTSMHLSILTIDWLFLIGLVKADHDGKILLCS